MSAGLRNPRTSFDELVEIRFVRIRFQRLCQRSQSTTLLTGPAYFVSPSPPRFAGPKDLFPKSENYPLNKHSHVWRFTVDPKTDRQPEIEQTAESEEKRRQLVRKLGRLAAYAAPFTVLAFAKKANAASGGGPRPLHR